MKLNIGAGNTQLEGFTPIDRSLGTEAFPLSYPDNTIEEIRASHILEHFNFSDARKALVEWVRVLKPGASIKIAVPDFDKILSLKSSGDPLWKFYLFGGQINAQDQHLSTWTKETLKAEMEAEGFEDIKEWAPDPRDTSSHQCSLNLRGTKPKHAITAAFASGIAHAGKRPAKICAVMSCPRLGWNDMWGETFTALSQLGIPFRRYTGAFWDQCIENIIEDLIKEGHDLALTLDYDSIFTAAHVDTLIKHCIENPDIDALAALQVKRCSNYPLLTKHGQKEHLITGAPFQVSTAHFGLTVIRLDALKEIPKPWFRGQPDKNGSWRGDDRLDADIWFWHQWRQHGRTLYVDPSVSIGHLEVMVSEFDEDFKARHVAVNEWRKAQKLKGQTE